MGNNAAVKEGGCYSPPSILRTLSLSPVPIQASYAVAHPFFLLGYGLETDSFSPQHLICGNRCSSVENCRDAKDISDKSAHQLSQARDRGERVSGPGVVGDSQGGGEQCVEEGTTVENEV